MLSKIKNNIIALGLNPAWQKTMTFEKLRFYEVNRARDVNATASGKGINFTRAAENWGSRKAVVFQFAGGETGHEIKMWLDREPLSHITVDVEADTRICNTCLCLETGKMTELIEPSGEITQKESESLFELIEKSIPESAGLALCGTFPPGISSEFYLNATRKARECSVPVLMDAWMNVEDVLRDGVEILKINDEEISELTGEKNIETAVKQCLEKYPVRIVAITAGPEKAYLGKENRLWEYTLHPLEKIVNPIGAGDTVSAVFFSEYISGVPCHEAYASALAAASASCLTATGGNFSRQTALTLREKMKVISL